MKATCPECGYSIETEYKSWKINAFKSQMIVCLFCCPKCTKKFRKAVKVDVDEDD